MPNTVSHLLVSTDCKTCFTYRQSHHKLPYYNAKTARSPLPTPDVGSPPQGWVGRAPCGSGRLRPVYMLIPRLSDSTYIEENCAEVYN